MPLPFTGAVDTALGRYGCRCRSPEPSPLCLQLGILARIWDGDQPHVLQQALSKYAKGVLLQARASGYLGPPHLLLAGPAGVAHAMSVDSSSFDYSLGDRLPYALSSAFTRGNALLQGAWSHLHAHNGPLASRIGASPRRHRTLPLYAPAGLPRLDWRRSLACVINAALSALPPSEHWHVLESALQVLLLIDIDRSYVGSTVVIEGPMTSRTKRLVRRGKG